MVKALNKIAITSAKQAPREASLPALLGLLAGPAPPPGPACGPTPERFAARFRGILAKLLGRVLAEEIEAASGTPFARVDLAPVLAALNGFFFLVPRRERGRETEYDAAAGLLRRVVLHLGADQVRNKLCPPHFPTNRAHTGALVAAQVAAMVARELPGDQGRPLADAMAREMPTAAGDPRARAAK